MVVYGGDEVAAIVLDMGTNTTRAGSARDSLHDGRVLIDLGKIGMQARIRPNPSFLPPMATYQVKVMISLLAITLVMLVLPFGALSNKYEIRLETR